jgi:hypothetical protein
MLLHSSFQLPQEDLAATRAIIMRFDRRDTIICDICDEPVASDQSAWLSPWFKMASVRVGEKWLQMMKSGLTSELAIIPDGFFVANWSYQRLCIKCFRD